MPNRREKYTLYFQSLIDELWEQHNFPNNRLVDGRDFHQFRSGTTAIYYVAGFDTIGGRKQRTRNSGFGLIIVKETKRFLMLLKNRNLKLKHGSVRNLNGIAATTSYDPILVYGVREILMMNAP